MDVISRAHAQDKGMSYAIQRPVLMRPRHLSAPPRVYGSSVLLPVPLSIPGVHFVEQERPALHYEGDSDSVEYRQMSFTPTLHQFNE